MLIVDAIWPKPLAETSAFGDPYCGWLKMLKMSVRKCSCTFSVTRIRLEMLLSICHAAGARSRLRGAFPQVPEAGTVNAGGLIQTAIDWPVGGINGTPGTKSGRWLFVLPSGVFVELRSIVTFTGKPVRAISRELTSHEPKIVRNVPGLLKWALPAP